MPARTFFPVSVSRAEPTWMPDFLALPLCLPMLAGHLYRYTEQLQSLACRVAMRQQALWRRDVMWRQQGSGTQHLERRRVLIDRRGASQFINDAPKVTVICIPLERESLLQFEA